MILFELDTASLKRRPIIPFFGRERYDSWISEQKIQPMDRALGPSLHVHGKSLSFFNSPHLVGFRVCPQAFFFSTKTQKHTFPTQKKLEST